MKTWRYYNHALLPTAEPHEKADEEVLKNPEFWKANKKALLARWTSDFDCGYETNWWYVIKDTPFDINGLKAKRRYEINKGKKNFTVSRIIASEYGEELFEVQLAAFSGWPEKYRPSVEKSTFINGLKAWDRCIVYGGFERDTGKLAAYAYLKEYDGHLEFSVLRARPEFERNGVNAAMVAAVVEDYSEKLSDGYYICDGARSIQHETAFQDYLEKYFGFRKAYCKLHIIYNPRVNRIIKLLFPFRKFLKGLDGIGLIHKVNSVLYMEELFRNDKTHK